jgi:hypothetical protein
MPVYLDGRPDDTAGDLIESVFFFHVLAFSVVNF